MKAGADEGTPLRLLLVEDSENDAVLLLRELRRGGYEPVHERVFTPEDMEGALKEAVARGEPYEVVISDYYMPRFRAPGALELLRRLGHDVPFIVVSGKIGEDAAVEIMKAGANDYLTKENMARLCPAIERELKEAEVRKERERAEAALARSEERYRTFIAQSSEGIWRFELEEPMPTELPDEEQLDHFYRHAYLAECNDVMARMYGLSAASDLVGARAGDLLPRSDPNNLRFLAQVVRGGYRLEGGESRELDRDGNERVFVNNVTGIVEDGHLVRIWGTQRDVTEQKEAEELLARLASFPELNPNPIVETNLAGEPTYLNPAAQARFPDLRELGPRHPALADLGEVKRRIWSAGGRPFVREVRVGEDFYQQTISRTPGGGLLRIYAIDVTERRRAEDSLREREERFRSLVQNASDIIVVLDEDGQILYESPAVERVLGFTPEERMGTNAFDLIHPEDRETVARAFRERRDMPGPFPALEYRVRDRGGAWRRLEAVGENLLHDPAVGGVVVNSRDVTERRRTEEALKQSEELFRTVVTNAPVVLFSLDAEGLFRLSTGRGLEILGLRPDELVGRSVFDVYAGSPGILDDVRRALSGEEFVGTSEVGGVVFETWYEPLRDEDGRVGGVIGVATDVTERAEAEEGLRRTLKELADLKFAIDESAIVAFTDVKGRITYVNDKFCQISGFSRDELMGRDHHIVNPGFHPEEYVRELWRTVAGGRVWRGELRNRAKDGSIYWVDTTIVPFLDDRGKPYRYVAIRHDVTARKQAEEALWESRENLQAILDNSTAVIYVKDGRGRYSLVNRRFEELFGLGKAEVIGKTDHDLFPKPTADEYWRNDIRVLRSEAPIETEEEALHADGSAHTYVSVKFPLRGPDGTPYATCGISTDITFRKTAESELMASEKRFRATFEQASVGVILVGTEGELLWVNGKLCEILGYDPEELVGANVKDITYPDDLRLDLERARRALAGEIDTYSLEKRYVRKDGDVVWTNVSASLVRGAGEEPEYFIRVVEDITDRRRAEDALREAERRYRTLVEGLPAATYVQDVATNRLSYLSPQIAGVLGYTPEEYLADPDLRRATTHPDDREWVLAEERRTDGTGEPYAVEYRRIAKDGSVAWVRDEAVLVRDEEGEPLYWQGFITDITDRRRAEEALRQSEELYRNVVEQAAESIFLVDVETKRILEANAALADTLGYTPEEIRGMTLYDVVAHDRGSVDVNTDLVLREGRRALGERRYRRKDGTLVDVEVNVSAIPYGGRKAMCIVSHDVTERRRAEEALGEIREAERNRIARELHDSILQDIVYALQGLQILQVTGGDDDGALEDTAEALRRSVEGLRAAIFDLRLNETLGRSFVASLESLVDLNRRMARGAYDLELAVGEGVPRGLSENRGREIVRIVQEALTNVRRHSGAGHVRVELGVEGDELYAEVRDDGRGFDPEDSRVGMGRHSMRQRALEIGGEVEIHSEPGGGTRVLCRVPLSRITGGVPSGGRDI